MALPLVFAITLLAGAPSEASVAEAWVVEGRISDNPHSHPIQPEKGQRIVYVDTVAEGQVVAYLTIDSPPRGSWVRFTGTALRFETTSPRPGSTKKFPVKQLTVEKTEALAGCDALQALLATRKDSPELRAAIEEAGKDAFPVLIASLPESRGGHPDQWPEYWLSHRADPFEGMRSHLKLLIDEYFEGRSASPDVP